MGEIQGMTANDKISLQSWAESMAACNMVQARQVLELITENQMLMQELTETRRRCEGLAERVAAQSELLTRRAGKEPSDKDWRIGLSVKPKYRNHELYCERGEVVDVKPNGTNGIVDEFGVLVIKMESGRVLMAASHEWVTAHV